MRSGFRARLARHDQMIGSFLKIPSTQPAEILGTLGFDFAVIDEEHAAFNPETTDAILLACRAHGMAGLVRVRDTRDILRVLDCGAEGVLVPHMASAEAVKKTVALTRYAGRRGVSPSTRAAGFGAGSIAASCAAQDARIAVIAMIEDAAALDRIADIVAVEGLDAIFIGQADLAMSMRCDPGGTDLAGAVRHILAAARAENLATMLLAGNPAEAEDYRALGVSSFLAGSDQGFLKTSAALAKERFKPQI